MGTLDTIYEGVNRETCSFKVVRFLCSTIDEACDLLDWLAWDTYEFETNCSESYIPPPCISNYTHPVCEICHCSYHDSTSYPYCISDDGFARLSSIGETMNKQQVKFVIARV